MKKVKPKINAYEIVCRAVEAGVPAGLRRAHKHADAPLMTDVEKWVIASVLLKLSEVLDYE